MPSYEFYESTEARTLAEKTFVIDLLAATPALCSHFQTEMLPSEDWESYDGMLFMGELLRICDKLADKEEGKAILRSLFDFLEARAEEFDAQASQNEEEWSPRIRAIWFLIFTFTDNPTLKDLTLKKLAPFMGPKIARDSGQARH